MAALIARIQASLPGRVLARYGEAKGGTWAIVIAWNSLFAFFPIVIVAVTLLGIALRSMAPDAAVGIEDSVARSLSQNPQQYLDILGIFNTLKGKTGGFAVVGLLSLVWSGSALVGAMDQGFDALYPCKPRSFIKEKLIAVQVILIFTVLMIPLMLSSALLSKLSDIPHLPTFLYTGPAAFITQFVVGSLDAALLFGAIFYIVPYRRMVLRRVLPGALAAGVMLEVFTLVFPLYARISHGFSTYGASFALFLLLLAYFYLTGQIMMLGATVNAELDPSPAQCVEEQDAAVGMPRPPRPASTRA